MNRMLQNWLGVAVVAVWMTGCGPSADYKPASQLPTAPAHEHHHDHSHAEGPHHGVVVELGEDEYHAELVLDAKAHSLKLYLLGPDGKTDATTTATEAVITTEDDAKLTLVAVPDTAEGPVSRFELNDEKLVHELAEAGFIHGKLAITIGDKSYTAELDVHFDGDHHHDHPPAAKPAEPAAGEGKADGEPAQP